MGSVRQLSRSDRCCIDKTSGAELSEAINSMYKWYQEAQICYVYLSDLRNHASKTDVRHSVGFLEREMPECRWFKRGWTLQELIAPTTVLFFDAWWQNVGSKSSLREIVATATGIPYAVLLGYDQSGVCIADRFKWAAKRETTRLEDQAYCLMGLFGVHMPILYGEGHQAFVRLQHEIIKSSNDHSLFAWMEADDELSQHSLFAPHAGHFSDFLSLHGSVRQRTADSLVDLPFYMTNIGLRCELPFRDPTHAGTCSLVLLNCEVVSDKPGDKPNLLIMGLDKDDDGHFVKNGRFIVVPDEREWQQSFLVRPLIIKHSGSRKRKLLPGTVQNPIRVEVPERAGPFYCQSRHDLVEYGIPRRLRWESGGQPLLEAWNYEAYGEDYCKIVSKFSLLTGVGNGCPWYDIVDADRELAARCDPEVLIRDLLQTCKLSDRASKTIGKLEVNASMRRGPKPTGSAIEENIKRGIDPSAHVYVVELNILGSLPLPLPEKPTSRLQMTADEEVVPFRPSRRRRNHQSRSDIDIIWHP